MNVIPVLDKQHAEALSLLGNASLPVSDIDATVELFALQTDNELAGTIGWQTNGTTGLLRSLSVKEGRRRNGFGEALVSFLETHARQSGVRSLYLLTTIAASFFSKQGFVVINRSEAPLFIQQTTEFKSICPASAIVMKKEL